MARILIIDDDEAILEWLEEILTNKGHSVVIMTDAEKAFNRHRTRKEFDLIITDILMPGFDGIDIISKLALNEDPIPIIAMSGGRRQLLNANLNLKAATAMGVKETIKKPFAELEIHLAIKRLLG